MNTATTAAIASINNTNAEIAKGRAVGLICLISRVLEAKKQNDLEIVDLQLSLKEIADSELTAAKVLGAAVPAEASQTETQKTIVKAVSELVKAGQGNVEIRAKQIGAAIVAKKSQNDQLDKDIAKLREDLNKIEVVVVDESTLTA